MPWPQTRNPHTALVGPALVHFLSTRRPGPAPLFCFDNGSYLTREGIVHILRAAYPAQSALNTHSFRVGGATALSIAGVPDSVIQILGRWSSDSFLRCIRVPGHSIRKYQKQMTAPFPVL